MVASGSVTFSILATLLESLTVECKKVGLDKELCAIQVIEGDNVPWDYGLETCGGMAYVHLVDGFPTATFPVATNDLNNCAYTLGFTVEVGILRPAPSVDDGVGGIELPSESEHATATQDQLRDMEVMFKAIRNADIDLKVLGAYSPAGPAGGVYGGTWQVTVGADL
jgi:hypothetical protein